MQSALEERLDEANAEIKGLRGVLESHLLNIALNNLRLASLPTPAAEVKILKGKIKSLEGTSTISVQKHVTLKSLHLS